MNKRYTTLKQAQAHPIVIGQELNEHKIRQFHGLDDLAQVDNLYRDNEELCFYEYISEPCRLYIDFELEGDDIEPKNLVIASLYRAFGDALKEAGCVVDDETREMMLFDSSRPNKISFHCVSRHYHVATRDEAKAFAASVRVYMGCRGVDLSVYHAGANMRMMNSWKHGLKSSIKRYHGTGQISLQESMITNTNDSTLISFAMLSLPSTKPSRPSSNERQCCKKFKEALMTLPAKYYTEYALWIKALFAVKNSIGDKDEAFELMVKFSSQSPHYVARKAQKHMHDILDKPEADHKVGIGTIMFWLKDEDPEKYYSIIRKYSDNPNTFDHMHDKENNLTWFRFVKKHSRQRYDSLSEFYSDLREVIAHYNHGGGELMIVKHEDEVAIEKVNAFLASAARFKVFHPENGEWKPFSFRRLINDALDTISCARIVFQPGARGLANTFNTFPGFTAVPAPVTDANIIKPILNHIREVWACDNREYFDYIVDWLASIVQTPNKKTGVCIVLISDQGAGKNIIGNFLVEHVFGPAISGIINDLDKITKRFNNALSNKLFTVLDETSNIEGNYHKTFDIMKSLISESEQLIERKGIDPIRVNDYNNYLMFSNNTNPVKIEATDRRYAIFEASGKYIGNRRYFAALANSLTKEAGEHFIRYLMNRDLTNFKVADIPETSAKRSIANFQRPAIHRFLDEAASGNLAGHALSSDGDSCFGEDGIKEGHYSKEVLYKMFSEWCRDNNERVPQRKMVERQLGSKGGWPNSRRTCVITGRRNMRCVKLNNQIVEAALSV